MGKKEAWGRQASTRDTKAQAWGRQLVLAQGDECGHW